MSTTTDSYYCARYYDPVLGRLLSEDPARFKVAPSFYPYVANRPTVSTDPTGLFPKWWHREVTTALALSIFGPKCREKAKAVGDAAAAVDDFNHELGHGPLGSVGGFLQFLTHTGEGWTEPGPHFPSAEMLRRDHDQALRTCNPKSFGEYLHSLQDSFAHSDWTSFDHFTHGSQPDDIAAGGAIADRAMLNTINALREFKSKCLNCCQ